MHFVRNDAANRDDGQMVTGDKCVVLPNKELCNEPPEPRGWQQWVQKKYHYFNFKTYVNKLTYIDLDQEILLITYQDFFQN